MLSRDLVPFAVTMTTSFPAKPRNARLLFFALLLAICSWHIETAPDDNTVSLSLIHI